MIWNINTYHLRLKITPPQINKANSTILNCSSQASWNKIEITKQKMRNWTIAFKLDRKNIKCCKMHIKNLILNWLYPRYRCNSIKITSNSSVEYLLREKSNILMNSMNKSYPICRKDYMRNSVLSTISNIGKRFPNQ
jgi:hypothetical protein